MIIKKNSKNFKKIRDALSVKESSLYLKVSNLVQELNSNFKIKNKNDLVMFTKQLFKNNEFLLNKPSLLLTCSDYLKISLILLNKSSDGVFDLNQINLIINDIKNIKYKFKKLEAFNLPQDQIKIKTKADIKKLRRILTGEKLKNFNAVLKNKRFKLGRTYTISNRLVFNCKNLVDKLVELCCNIIFTALIQIKKLFPNELYSYSNENNIIKFQYDWRKISFTPRFLNKLDISQFFPNLKKKFVILALNQIINKSDIILYSLLKNLFNRGYYIKIARFSKKIGSKKVIEKDINVGVFQIYQGTILAPIISNLINFLIIKELKKLLINFNIGQRSVQNLIKKKYSNKLYQEKNKKNIDLSKIKLYNLKIRKLKTTVFSNRFKRARIFVYCDDIIVVTHLSNNENTLLINDIENVYNTFGLKFNKDKTTKKFCFNNNQGITFLGFYLRGPNIIRRSKKNAIKSNCRIGIDTIKIKNKFELLGILKKRNCITGLRDRNKELKNKIKKRNNLYRLTKKEKKIRNKSIYDPNYKVLALLPVTTLNPKNVFLFFYHKMLGLINYFKYCDYTNYLQYFLWILKMACLKTLCAKFKINTVKGLFRKFGDKLEKLNLMEIFNKFNNLPNQKLFIKLNKNQINKSDITYEQLNKRLLQINTSTQSDVEKLFCTICNSTNNLQLHHIKNIAKIRSEIKKLRFNYKNSKYLEHNANRIFKLIHVAKNRKQIVVCNNCHVKIHNKTLEKRYLNNFTKKL